MAGESAVCLPTYDVWRLWFNAPSSGMARTVAFSRQNLSREYTFRCCGDGQGSMWGSPLCLQLSSLLYQHLH